MNWRTKRFPAPIIYSSHSMPRAETAMAAVPEEPTPSAVLVFHGVGQQVRFETLSDLASAILDEAEIRGGNVTGLHIGLAPKGDTPGAFLARAEIAWSDKAGNKHAAHVYEAYWAALTQGKVSYWDTIKFLLEAGWNGLRCSLLSRSWSFDRWVFGDFKSMAVTKGTPLALLAALLVVGFTIAIVAMAGSAMARIATQLHSPGPLTAIRAVLSTIYLQIASPWNGVVYFLQQHSSGGTNRATWYFPGLEQHVPWGYFAIALLAWSGLIVAAVGLRYFIVEFVGDLAAYLAAYKASKFDKLRGAIQKVGLDAARLVYFGSNAPQGALNPPRYSSGTPWIPDYRNIVVAGHSLGSVVAYDTLNAIFNIENTCNPPGAPNRAMERTRAFITFGSPLDKTAFLFRAQFNRDTQVGRLREMTVAAIQPLITDYAFRYNSDRKPHGPRWINLWSPRDPISGNLDYYDDPAQAPSSASLIQNKIDPAGTIPFYAHVQYWKGKLLRETVYEQLI